MPLISGMMVENLSKCVFVTKDFPTVCRYAECSPILIVGCEWGVWRYENLVDVFPRFATKVTNM